MIGTCHKEYDGMGFLSFILSNFDSNIWGHFIRLLTLGKIIFGTLVAKYQLLSIYPRGSTRQQQRYYVVLLAPCQWVQNHRQVNLDPK